MDPQAKKAHLVLLVWMAALVPLAQLDPEASPVTSDSPAPRDLEVRLAKVVIRDQLVQLV